MKKATNRVLQDQYDRIQMIDLVYRMCGSNEINKDFVDSSKLKYLLPVDIAFNGYFSNRVEFTDKRAGEKYTDEFNWNDEGDRLRCLLSINEKIQDFNKFYEQQKTDIGIEKTYAKWGAGEWEYPLYSINLYMTHPTTWKHPANTNVINQKTINNKYVYNMALKMNSEAFCIRFNKMMYDWVIAMLPQSFNDKDMKFLSNDHIYYHPKLEYENWFQSKGIMINSAPTLLDPKNTPKEHSDISVVNNQLKTAHKVIKDLRASNKMLKNKPFEVRIVDLIKTKEIDSVVDNCRFKSGSINWSKLSRELGCTDKTAKKMLIDKAPYLLRVDDQKYLKRTFPDKGLDKMYEIEEV